MGGAAEEGTSTTIDPEEFLRSALEKIVFFECRVSTLESELAAARATAERARHEAVVTRRRETELEQALAAERGARDDADRRVSELSERIRLLEEERERLLGGLVERARLSGATASDGSPGPEEGGADLAGFIAELRAEIEVLRGWKSAAEAVGISSPSYPGQAPAADAGPQAASGASPHPPRARGPESISDVAGRFDADRRVGLSRRDSDQMKALLATRADRALYERSLDDLSAPDAGRRLRAVRALEALGSKAAAPLLAGALGREPEAEVKAALLSALARFKEPFAAELAVRAFGDARPAVRVAALETLAAVAAGSAEDRLAAALGDPSPLVRRRAALLLGFSSGENVEVALSSALADPDRGVARAAAAALSGRPTARAQGALARGLEHPDASVRHAVASALGPLAGERVDADASPSDRRATSRRIAEKLAAMGGEEIRSAVLAAAPGPATATPVPTATRTATATAMYAPAPPERSRGAATPTPTPTPTPTATRTATATSTPTSISTSNRTATSSRTAVATLAPAEPSLEPAIVAEVRAALRGCTSADLSAALGAPASRVDATLAALASKGTLVQRGPRWFMA